MITVEHLTKRYGDFTAVDDLSFEIEEGHVYGFLGPNGAGKSTTMNIMAGCLSATAGYVRIGGYDIFEEPARAKKLIGYLPEQPPLYMNETPLEYLKFVGAAKGLKGRELAEQIEVVISQTKLEERKRNYYYNGEEQEMAAVRSAIMGLKAVSYTDEQPALKEEVSLTIYLDNENDPEVHIQLYRYDGENCIAVVDGEVVALVERAKVVDLAEAVRTIVLD